jgi:hypothetical protein
MKSEGSTLVIRMPNYVPKPEVAWDQLNSGGHVKQETLAPIATPLIFQNSTVELCTEFDFDSSGLLQMSRFLLIFVFWETQQNQSHQKEKWLLPYGCHVNVSL